MGDGATGTAVRRPAAGGPRRPRAARHTVAVLGTGVFAVGTDLFVVAGVLGGIATDLGVSVGSAGLVVTVFALSYAAGAVLLGPLLSVRPPGRVLVVSAAAFAALNLLAALAPGFPVLLAVRLLAGLAASAYVPAAAAAAAAAIRRVIGDVLWAPWWAACRARRFSVLRSVCCWRRPSPGGSPSLCPRHSPPYPSPGWSRPGTGCDRPRPRIRRVGRRPSASLRRPWASLRGQSARRRAPMGPDTATGRNRVVPAHRSPGPGRRSRPRRPAAPAGHSRRTAARRPSPGAVGRYGHGCGRWAPRPSPPPSP